MTRPVAWAFVVGLILIVAGLVVSTIAPSAGGHWLVIAGTAVMAGIVVAVFVLARRSSGWTRVWNPGAARREYEAEQAARRRDHPGGDSGER